jgi:hypothetical protein
MWSMAPLTGWLLRSLTGASWICCEPVPTLEIPGPPTGLKMRTSEPRHRAPWTLAASVSQADIDYGAWSRHGGNPHAYPPNLDSGQACGAGLRWHTEPVIRCAYVCRSWPVVGHVLLSAKNMRNETGPGKDTENRIADPIAAAL